MQIAIRSVLCLCAFMALNFGLSGIASSGEAFSVTVAAPMATSSGGIVTVTVGTVAADAFKGWQVELQFDNSKVQLLPQSSDGLSGGQVAGSFADNFAIDPRDLTEINSGGSVGAIGVKSGNASSVYSGTGSLAVFTFAIISLGDATFNLLMYDASSRPFGTTLLPCAGFKTPTFRWCLQAPCCIITVGQIGSCGSKKD